MTLPKTTEGAVALSNLSAQIASLQDALDRAPRLSTQRQMLDALLTRTQFTGSFTDFDRAEALSLEARDAYPDRPEPWLMRADFLSSVHLFQDALDALVEAELLGATEQSKRRATYWLALGTKLEDALALREQAHARAPSYETLVALAAVEAELGDFEGADAHYREALQTHGDVSPMPYAWVQFQRGVMWGEKADQADVAADLYRSAVDLLPGYVVANTHLAELEVGTDAESAAVERLLALSPETDDPEPSGKLASYLASSQPDRAERLRSRATEGYDSLLAAHREAFLDHASEFFASAGADPERGLRLALENLDLRRNARAYLVALGAAEAVDHTGELCDLWEEARAAELPNRNLELALDDLAERCSAR